MTAPPVAVVHVVGQLRAADPVAATARAVRDRLALEGWPGPLVAIRSEDGDEPAPGSTPEGHVRQPDSSGAPTTLALDALSGLDRAVPVVVHTVDGGEDLEPALDRLAGRTLTLVHHGSGTGRNRAVLRTLRDSTRAALAPTAAGREELRALGFAAVSPLADVALAPAFDGAFAHVVPDEATARRLDGHPGPLILAVGPLALGSGAEALLEAFTEVVTRHRPAAVLSLCGPVPRWQGERLRRRIAGRGLLSCEVVSPRSDSEVLARLDAADVLVAWPPAPLDPYRWRAGRRGVPIVTVPGPSTDGTIGGEVVALANGATRTAIVAALVEALDRGVQLSRSITVTSGSQEPVLARALGLA